MKGLVSVPVRRKAKPDRRLELVMLGLGKVDPRFTPGMVAVAMPAYRERETLRDTVEGILTAFGEAGRGCIVVIADDGGTDGTPRLVRRLVKEYPGRVVAASHRDQRGLPFNQGYATACWSALGLAAKTGCGKILTTDADGQFDPADMVRLVQHAETGCYDVVFGVRSRRADGLRRMLVGRAWTGITRLWTGFWGLKDADCAVKLFRTEVVKRFRLRGRHGTAGAELAAWSRALNLRIGQFPVRHLPRAAGEQSGNNLRVITGSLASLPRVYANLYRHGHRLTRLRRLWRPRDPGAYWVTVVAAALSVCAFSYYFTRGMTLLYPDAVSHLLIAHRATASPTPGLAQYGDVWLPGTHIPATLLMIFPGAYATGLGGSLVSMLAFVVAARYLYKTAFAITGWVWSGVAAAAIFMLNPNVLYLQSTPMEEVPLYACVAAALFLAVRYGQTRSWRYVAGLSLAAAIGCTIRYEGWVIALALLPYVAGVNLLYRLDRHRFKASVLMYAFTPALFLLLWLIYSAAIFGNPLQWYNGPYAKPSNWVGQQDVAIHHPLIAAQTYWYAMADTLGRPLLILLLVAAALFVYGVVRRRCPAAPLVLLVMPAFFVWALYAGQRPLHVMQINHELYNVRFALIMVLAGAIFVGCAVAGLRRLAGSWRAVPVGLIGALALGGMIVATPATTVAEARFFSSSHAELANVEAAESLHDHWTGGYALIQNYGAELQTFRSQIPLDNVIYEGNNNGDLWQRALKDPAGLGVRLIYMRRTQGQTDLVWQALHGSPGLQAYHLVYSDPSQLIYSWGTGPDLPATEASSAAPGTEGLATWYAGPSGTCLTSLAPLGSTVKVVSQSNSASFTCRVAGAGPSLQGRIVNVEAGQFTRLGNLASGVAPVRLAIISTTQSD